MKNIFKCMIASCLLFTLSCEKEAEPIPSLDVTPANIAGTWELSEWNGKALDENTYFYITFNRRDLTFEMYQKFDSMYARYITGTFKITDDPYEGYVISGIYDYTLESWNNEYIVTDLYESGSMIWTVKDNPDDVCKYVRCEKVPDEIVEESRKETI